MDYLLDTNVISGIVEDDPLIKDWLYSIGSHAELATCTVVLGEIRYGLAKLPEGRRRSELDRKVRSVLSAFPCHPIPVKAAEAYARLKLSQQRQGLSVADNDLWIAATALVYSETLVTRDADFRRIDELAVVTP